VFSSADPEKACAFVKTDRPDVVFCNIIALASRDSRLLYTIRTLDAALPVIILTSLATIEAAAAALREGALFYLLMPLTLHDLKPAVERALSYRHDPWEPVFGSRAQHQAANDIIVGTSRPLQEVLELVAKVARTDANVIIFGESGTGKELVAKLIHTCSQRAEGGLIPVDCASLPDNLLEAELFGYEKGAFTGASHTKPGVMELANRGTLFFDEIGELPLSLQPKLLRALQQRQHRRLGGTKMVDFDVRVVSATNRDLRSLVSQGHFREDLYYRLNVVPLHLPPLRARGKDVVLLANHFLKECGRKSLSAPKRFAPEVLGLFEECPWPGNVRELQNVVEYSCAVAQEDTITFEDLPAELRVCHPQVVEVNSAEPMTTFKVAKARFEKGYVLDLLKRHDYNISQTAKIAGVDRKTFYSLIQRHHIPIPRPK
jgi:DNA-binding NtrC family response regulator